MSTYLQLCQDMARDIGIPGTGPSSVTASGLSEEEIAVVRYIKNADLLFGQRLQMITKSLCILIGMSTSLSINWVL
jgi:hypothetical protein